MREKLKSLVMDDTFFIAGLIILVGAGSFGLGRLSAEDKVPNQASLYESTMNNRVVQPKDRELPPPNSEKAISKERVESTAPTSAKSQKAVPQDVLPYVASKSGTKYHKLSCPGAKQIKEENKIYFATAEEAMAAGYAKAANCKDE